jgi:hypothetical protein
MEAVWDQQADRAPGGSPYARHWPEQTLLYQVIDDNYPDFVARFEAEERALPRFVRREFEALLAPMTNAAVTALLREGEASNTVASYRSALRYWATWFALRYREPITLPVSPATILLFTVDHA